MNDNNPMQSILGDLQWRYQKLESDLKKLNNFQKDIETLKDRASQDDKAREALLRLNSAFPNGFKQEKAKLMICISQMKLQFKQMETQLKNINSNES
ncbi:chromosome partitioning protein ParA [Yersinia alsatica]|uniref:Chromosome partitioning protein ParA n=1 Tax=Yersinia alsatica TaxID=2890317 RepID=A0ABY5UTU8_9GAMM|nr:chromosome partitioning protein ParA [Yersinia alsatica]OWF66973.1 chromosome partitioning protein ParA [Yersinia frederiksenii]UWM45572.1 chromosome partitioning protein ParA [Yersinia alsatica]CNL73363.1 Chromosome segregation ATPase [Yersinia frederiksenii]CNL96303.1 Chromosome segregation ATPase [Yersinia frederiksenii]